jgi:hypothetical protein
MTTVPWSCPLARSRSLFPARSLLNEAVPAY